MCPSLYVPLSRCLSQVGACIVNQENKIVGIGYNGMPNGCNDDLLPWSRSADDRLDTKYPYGENAHCHFCFLLQQLVLKWCIWCIKVTKHSCFHPPYVWENVWSKPNRIYICTILPKVSVHLPSHLSDSFFHRCLSVCDFMHL